MASESYTLYQNPYSLHSIIARYTISTCKSLDDGVNLTVREREVDIFTGEHMSNEYRNQIDEQSLVPALVCPLRRKSLVDIVAITEHLGDLYPELLPSSYRQQILNVLRILHSLDWFSLSLPAPKRTGSTAARVGSHDAFRAEVTQRIHGESCAWHRAALGYRLKLIEENAKDATILYATRERARQLLQEFQQLLEPQRSKWLLGLAKPSALDAHLVPLLARLEDAGNEQLIPQRLREYSSSAQTTPAWESVMQGRSTLR